LTLNLGTALALLCAIATQVGFLCKHRGANAAPAVRLRRPLQSGRSLMGSGWFAAGMAIAAGAWVLHAAALALAPLSMVQAVLASGVLAVAVLGDRFFDCPVSRRQWIGVGMTALGMLALVLTLPGSDAQAGYGTPMLLAFEAGVLLVGVALIAASTLRTPARHHGAVLGAAAGCLFGLSDVAIKALTHVGGGPLAMLASPFLLVALLGGVLAFLCSARAFQAGDAVPVIAATATAANITSILGGLLVFGDALSGNGVLFAIQIAAFALIAAAALVTPSGHGRVAAA